MSREASILGRNDANCAERSLKEALFWSTLAPNFVSLVYKLIMMAGRGGGRMGVVAHHSRSLKGNRVGLSDLQLVLLSLVSERELGTQNNLVNLEMAASSEGTNICTPFAVGMGSLQ